MLSCLPNAEEVVDAAKSVGWRHRRIELGGVMRDVLDKPGHSSLILQPIPEESWYSHKTARSYARLLGIGIEPPPSLPKD
jgi:hypothetical protein